MAARPMPGIDPSRRDALPAGTTLREYTLESVVGHGGFGIVYRAQHDELRAIVAIKEYLPIELVVREGVQVRVRSAAHSRTYQDGLRRFRDEARALMQFKDHPGVVSCREFFRAHGTAYMVMEFEDGCSLAEVLVTREGAGRPFDQADLLGVMVPLLEGLERVHEAGLLHRDIKPANILIRRVDGRPVLIDFGASKQVVANQSKSMAPYTEGYAALEQVAATGELGTWTDMYGVGAVMWRMVAGGQPPWQPLHPVRVERRSHALVGDSEDPLPPAVQLGEGRFSPRVVQAIDACLCLQEKRRIQTCRELLSVLRPDVPPVPSKSPGTNATPERKAPSASPAQPSRTPPVAPKLSEVAPEHLRRLLHDRFGHDEFRPHQEEVCQAVAAGRDLLLVMPPGAGKSLCYQLPGIARGATTLVISPLTELMEDQADTLWQQGFRAERIRSDHDWMESERVCQEYLAGELDFLYIAPECLFLQEFWNLLARRTPSLVAIDEAHCISMWGHDFRSEYRRLRERIRILRPAPVIALTSTATPLVQNDIVAQLGLIDCQRSIHGFRRLNIEIELVEIETSLRPQVLLGVLSDPNRRPAIVYAPTRKAAHEQVEVLQAEHRVDPYHAGMTGTDRARTLSRFLGGDIDVVVATIPCGMGIDKPDVRSVIHTGLPGSIEGYYQEIGRAGRDGLPSKAILLYDSADREPLERILDRDYPAPEKIMTVFQALSDRPSALEDLPNPFGPDIWSNPFGPYARPREMGIQKLWLHGGIRFKGEGNVRENEKRAIRGDEGWLESYRQQRDHQIKQLDLVTEFTLSQSCRISDLVRHFGDLEDSLKPCGRCDTCDEAACLIQKFRCLTALESQVLNGMFVLLRKRAGKPEGMPVGLLFRKIAKSRKMKRAHFERLVEAAVRANLFCIDQGQQGESRRMGITTAAYFAIVAALGWPNSDPRRMGITSAGYFESDPASLVKLPVEGAELVPAKKARARRKEDGANGRPGGTQMSLGSVPLREGADELLASGLRAWRKTEAQRRGVPAFMIFNNPTLDALVEAKPMSEAELLGVPGVGAVLAKKYGGKLIQIIRSAGS